MREDFTLKPFIAKYASVSGAEVARDKFTARNTAQAVAFVRSRAPGRASTFVVCDAEGKRVASGEVRPPFPPHPFFTYRHLFPSAPYGLRL